MISPAAPASALESSWPVAASWHRGWRTSPPDGMTSGAPRSLGEMSCVMEHPRMLHRIRPTARRHPVRIRSNKSALLHQHLDNAHRRQEVGRAALISLEPLDGISESQRTAQTAPGPRILGAPFRRSSRPAHRPGCDPRHRTVRAPQERAAGVSPVRGVRRSSSTHHSSRCRAAFRAQTTKPMSPRFAPTQSRLQRRQKSPYFFASMSVGDGNCNATHNTSAQGRDTRAKLIPGTPQPPFPTTPQKY